MAVKAGGGAAALVGDGFPPGCGNDGVGSAVPFRTNDG